MSQPTFDEILAYRLTLQTHIEDEITIIKRLKLILRTYGMNTDEINQYLFNFYNTLSFNYTLEDIQNININANTFLSIFISGGDIDMAINEQNPNDDINIGNILSDMINEYESPNNSLLHSIPILINDIINVVPNYMFFESELNLLNNLTNFINNNNNNPFQDVQVTLDDKVLNKLHIYKSDKKQDDRCTICLADIDIDNDMIKLECNHYYHSDCILTYLKNYNYKCPICRIEVGQSKATM
jgi:hypothetical protein